MGFCRERLSASTALEHEPASMSKQQEGRPGPQQQQDAGSIPEGSGMPEPASDKENDQRAASDGMRPPAPAPSLLGDLKEGRSAQACLIAKATAVSGSPNCHQGSATFTEAMISTQGHNTAYSSSQGLPAIASRKVLA